MKHTKLHLFVSLVFTFLIFSPLVFSKTITEKDIIALTKAKSLSSQNLNLEKEITEATLQKANSQYDTTLSSYVAYTLDRSARANVVFGTENKTTNFNLGLTQLAPTGTQISFGFNNTREQSDSPFASSNDLFESELALSLTQPILKNFLGTNTRKTIELAKNLQQSQAQQVNSQLLELTYNHILLYWNWYYIYHAEKIQKESVSLASQLFENNKKKKQLGLIESSEIHAFSSNYDLKKSELLTSQIQKTEAEENLKSRLSLDESLSAGTESFSKARLGTLDQMLAEALDSNPKLITAKEQLKAKNIELAIQKNSRLPQIDLLGSLSLNGIDSKYGQALANIDDYNPTWQAGVQFSFPLQNKAARSDYKTSRLQKQQLINSVKDLENDVLASVRMSYNNYKRLAQKVAALDSATKNQKLKWQAEVKKFEQGRSDYDFIITYQNEYLQTRLLYLRAKVDMRVEQAKLKYALGTL